MTRDSRLENSSVGNFTSILCNDLAEVFDKHTNKIVDAIKSLKEPALELPGYVETNLNYHIKVKLTEHGREIHRKYWEHICRDCGHEYKYPEVDESGYSCFQMHEFMHIFGSEMFLAAELVCETNVLIQRSR